jgi:hypothetical protein
MKSRTPKTCILLSANFGRVFNVGFRSPADPYFAKLVKTDFLWSIALKSVDPSR